MKDIEIENALKDLNIKFNAYSLVNNYGYTFSIGQNRSDIRHNLNVYGASVDYWDITVFYPNNKAKSLNFDSIEKLKFFIEQHIAS
jgi:hypothetical protein